MTMLLEECLSRQCFDGTIDPVGGCHICGNRYIAEKVSECKRDKGICRNYNADIGCVQGEMLCSCLADFNTCTQTLV